jgi:hypothetical protein
MQQVSQVILFLQEKKNDYTLRLLLALIMQVVRSLLVYVVL